MASPVSNIFGEDALACTLLLSLASAIFVIASKVLMDKIGRGITRQLFSIFKFIQSFAFEIASLGSNHLDYVCFDFLLNHFLDPSLIEMNSLANVAASSPKCHTRGQGLHKLTHYCLTATIVTV